MSESKTHFTKRFAGKSGIGELMEDMGKAMSGDDMLMLGGGNPAGIPEVQALWRERLSEMLKVETEIDQALLNYDSPQGNRAFITALADFLNRHYGFGISEKNIAVTNGSQTAMFNLMNLLGGTCDDGVMRKILFPVVPEYIGYADQHLEPEAFISLRPIIDMVEEHRFKYRMDYDALESVNDNLGALCISRPTNPTGNVLTNSEVDYLHNFCKKRNIPLIIDNAYGAPFPQILFKDIDLKWDEDIILSMSLSKVGLPSTRTGIIIAKEEIITALDSVNAITSLSTGSLGQIIITPMLKNDKLHNISRDIIKPYYFSKSEQILKLIDNFFDGIDYNVHVSEGAIFLWMWFPNLPITSQELYNKLKLEKVLVIPGHYFFYGLDEPWDHSNKCIRINYSQDISVVTEGLKIISRVIKEL